MNYYALFYDVVDDFVNRRAPYRAEHLRLAQAAHDRGELLLGGALSDPADRALLVFRTADRATVEDFARHDPYVMQGLVRRWEVRPWTVVIGNEEAHRAGRGTVDIQMHNRRGIKIAEVVGDEVCLRSGQDLLDLLSHLYGTEAQRIVLREEQLDPAFFDLRTGLAGEITQKFVNYHLKAAIVGQFEKYSSKALADFIRESNQGKQLFFTASVSEALARLATS